MIATSWQSMAIAVPPPDDEPPWLADPKAVEARQGPAQDPDASTSYNNSPMHLALPTCANLPDWEVDDRPLVAALEARGAAVSEPAWDDPGVDWSGFDACLIRTTWDYMERPAEYLAWAEHAGRVSRLFNPPGAVRWNLDKRYLRDLADHGIPTVPTVWLPKGTELGPTGVDLPALLAEKGWERAFLKPMVGATARETLRFEATPEGLARARAHLERLLPAEGMMLQPYLPRVEREGERSGIFFQGEDGRLELSHGVVKVPVPGDYRVQDDFGASDAPVELTRREREVAGAAVTAVERPGLWRGDGSDDEGLLYARVDLLRGDGDEVYVSELELVEPSLFFRHHPAAAERLAEALLRRLS